MRRCQNCFSEVNDDLEMCPYCGHVEGNSAEEAIHLNPGTILSDRYIIGKVLGYGGFGVTYLAWDAKLEMKVAIKEYLPSEFSTRMPGRSQVTIFNGDKAEQFGDGLNKFVDEARRLAKFQNEDGIVKVYDCIAENETAYIIMEYLEGETLTEFLKREKSVSEDKAIAMMMPIMKSLQTVHAEGILHRDIAPDNVFITKEGKVKLIDFGAARFATTSHSRSLTVIVKPGYSPEEQYRSRSDQGEHTDVYAVAATMYKMMTGVTPPDALERRAKIQNNRKDIIVDPRKINSKISQNRENAIMNALNVQVEDRTKTIAQFIEELQSEEPVKRIYGKIKKIDFYTWPLWLKVLVPSLAAVLVVFGVLLATGVIKFSNLFSTANIAPDGYVVIPNVEGMAYDEAIVVLQNAELNCVTDNSLISEFVEANKILYQTPEAGSFIIQNGKVYITISRGEGEVILPIDGVSTVPFFVGLKKDDADKSFEVAGFKVTYEEEFSDTIGAGQVIRVTTTDGVEVKYEEKLPENTSLIVYISKGQKPIQMPDLYNMTEAEARQKILDAKLVVGTVNSKVDSNVKAGNVCGQTPAAGESVYKGDSVTIDIAIEDPDRLVKVDNVVGKKSKDAKTALTSLGFKVSVVEEYNDEYAKGVVYKQDPTSGEEKKVGSKVTIFVSKGAKSVTPTSAEQVATPTPTKKPATPTPTKKPATPTSAAKWSDWVTSLPNGVDESNYEIEKKTEYRYRNKETTTSSSSSLSGWTLENSSYSSWGSWSNWGTTSYSKSDTREVGTKTDKVIKSYYMEYYCTKNTNGTREYRNYSVNGNYSNYGLNKSYGEHHYDCTYTKGEFDSATVIAPGSKQGGSQTGVNKADVNGYAIYFGQNKVIMFINKINYETYTYYRYRDRSIIYNYYRWTDWSNWSSNNVSGTETDTRTLYRYKHK